MCSVATSNLLSIFEELHKTLLWYDFSAITYTDNTDKIRLGGPNVGKGIDFLLTVA